MVSSFAHRAFHSAQRLVPIYRLMDRGGERGGQGEICIRASRTRTVLMEFSFFPRTCYLWNLLPSWCFPKPYNLPSFNSKINKLDLIFLSPVAVRFLLSSFVGALYRPPWPYLNITHSKIADTYSINHSNFPSLVKV